MVNQVSWVWYIFRPWWWWLESWGSVWLTIIRSYENKGPDLKLYDNFSEIYIYTSYLVHC